ncbi:hypothetical protein IW262DRAFT_1469762 [Armillaria fumosa]|nr:hypothetical protein IW262DRAFT_1469762 [Armillaria fumosa]
MSKEQSSGNTSLPHSLAETIVSRTSCSLADKKQMNPWDGYENDEMPEKMQPRLQAFSIYRRLFSSVFVMNMGIFISYAIRGETPSRSHSWPFQATREFVNKNGTSVATVVLTYIIRAFLTSIVIFRVHPTLRVKRHDTFERVHRFLGWTATALVVLLTNNHRGERNLGNALVHSAPFWPMIILSCSFILPWLFVDYGPHPVPGLFQ